MNTDSITQPQVQPPHARLWLRGTAALIFSLALFSLGTVIFEMAWGALLASSVFLGAMQVLYMLSNRKLSAGGWGAPVLGVLLSTVLIAPISRFLIDQTKSKADDILTKAAAFQEKYGHAPSSISDLCPEFMSEVPSVNLFVLGDHGFHFNSSSPMSISFRCGDWALYTRSQDGTWTARD